MPSKHAVMEGAYDFHKRLIRSHVTDVTAGSHVTAASGRDLIGGELPCRESHHCSVTAPAAHCCVERSKPTPEAERVILTPSPYIDDMVSFSRFLSNSRRDGRVPDV